MDYDTLVSYMKKYRLETDHRFSLLAYLKFSEYLYKETGYRYKDEWKFIRDCIDLNLMDIQEERIINLEYMINRLIKLGYLCIVVDVLNINEITKPSDTRNIGMYNESLSISNESNDILIKLYQKDMNARIILDIFDKEKEEGIKGSRLW